MFGPHFGRTQRRLKFTDKVIDSEGKLREVELPGPRDLEQWNQCSVAYECATISVRAFKTTCERQGKESEGQKLQGRLQRIPGLALNDGQAPSWPTEICIEMQCVLIEISQEYNRMMRKAQ